MVTQSKKIMAAGRIEWIDVNDALPPMNEEVIVLTNQYKVGLAHICFGHIVDKRFAIDYNGWNIPDVTHWIYCPPMPSMYKGLE